MCTYETYSVEISGSGKGPTGWMSLSTATVYYDHPVHAFAEHTLNVDLTAHQQGPAARVAVELTAESAVRLISTLADALLGVPVSISGLDPAALTVLRAVATNGAAARTEGVCHSRPERRPAVLMT
jgi:hypothetical protein